MASVPDASRREALRKAGEDYISQALQKSSLATGVGGGGQNKDGGVEQSGHHDEDLEVVGLVIEGATPYVSQAIFVACQAAGVVLMERCTRLLKAPFLVGFWHMLPLPFILWGMSISGAVRLRDYSPKELQANGPVMFTQALQMLALLYGLLLGGIGGTLCWICTGLILLEVVMDVSLFKRHLEKKQRACLALALSGLVLQTVGKRGAVLGCIVAMSTWTIAQGVRFLLELGKKDMGSKKSDLLRKIDSLLGTSGLSEEDTILLKVASNWSPADFMFYQHTLSLLPLLIMGFLSEEVYTLAGHDLTVFQATCLLLSCIAYTGMHLTALYIGKNKKQPQDGMVYLLTFVGALVLDLLVGHRLPTSPIGVIGSLLASGSTILRRHHCFMYSAEVVPHPTPSLTGIITG